MEPAEPSGLPVPAPPASKGDPEIAVSDPSGCRSKPATELVPELLLLTYTWPTTVGPGAADTTPDDVPIRTAARAPPSATRRTKRCMRVSWGVGFNGGGHPGDNHGRRR